MKEALPTVGLLDQGNGVYAAYYDGFKEAGSYRIVLYADDDQGLEARPVEITVRVGSRLYLPLVAR